ncbi:MAG: 4'-phosphopantetheinyl transferase superfamily protein [Bacteroidales bacterium]|nr:4'-phosphopantetheinyl transferase superfamily protein [Bacteroidales bacterium]MBP3343585.1 4'-phosphopantetheinyl transferase superfamily protein [Bacteroidales bacterium]MBQ3521360.1 4'-phosphopantetheinyl transferase superfamily protein [Bacteroidales bacterium]MBQ5803427.1 4'-phosphopantetheinyl transferase superfamily protein [Bacteroidales bacterium]MBQ6871807.1 4'-phosphopantetheinyl transferase superfamily protein [Bacteroidales bacterium]
MGLYLRKKLDQGGEISVWEVTESEEELLKIISIPNDELEELYFTRSESRRKEKLAVRALLNTVFEDKVYLGHHDNGSPFIQNNSTHISITHTTRFVAIITHPTEDVGIDIECLERDFSAVEKKALSEEEREDLSDKHRNLQLAIYWCAKEAIYKRMSQHGVDFAKQMEVDKFNPKDEGEIDATFIDKDGEEEEFELEYEVFDNHVLVWLVG